MGELQPLGREYGHQFHRPRDPGSGVGNRDVEPFSVTQPGEKPSQAHAAVDFRHGRRQSVEVVKRRGRCSTRVGKRGLNVDSEFTNSAGDEIADRLAGVRTHPRHQVRHLHERFDSARRVMLGRPGIAQRVGERGHINRVASGDGIVEIVIDGVGVASAMPTGQRVRALAQHREVPSAHPPAGPRQQAHQRCVRRRLVHHFEQCPRVSDRRIREEGGRSGHPGRNPPRSQRPIHPPDVLSRGAQDRDRLVGAAGRRPPLLHCGVHLTHTRREELHLRLDGVEQSDVHPRR